MSGTMLKARPNTGGIGLFISPAMRGKFCLFFMVYGFLCGAVYGWGKTEEKAAEPQNPEWVLAVTAFDVSALPLSRQSMGDIITKNLINTLNTIKHRVRVSPEYAYYEGYAWSKNRAAAAKALASKRTDRDNLLFKGDPEWKYRKNRKALDEEIKKLEESLGLVEGEAPPIVSEPVFKFIEGNNTGTFPPPPKTGGEYRFCVTQKADAFLGGTILEFHGRLYVQLKLYALYTQSFVYEDSIIFSIEDIQPGVDELAGRLVAVVSGTKPAAMLIHGNPEEAMILIDGSFAGRGEVGPREHPPGSVEIESFADNYQALTAPLELHAGELAELYINLQPLSREALTIGVPGLSSARVYQGALYLGQTPLPVEVPFNQFTFFHVETPEGKTGSRIIHREAPSPGIFLEVPSSDLILETGVPATGEEKRVEKARRQFYGAWGRFWLALPTAFILQGINNAQISSYNLGNYALYDPARTSRYIVIGAWIVFGLVTAEVLFRTSVYIYTSWKDADPLVRSP